MAIVRDMLVQLIAEVAGRNVKLGDLEWRDLERLVHEVLLGLGFMAHLTPAAKDGGKDVVCCEIRLDGVDWYNVEVKHWRNRRVGSREVSDCLEAAIREGRQGALLLASSGVSGSAVRVRTESRRDYLRFGGAEKIVSSCQTYVNRGGVWATSHTLREFLFSETS